MYRAIRDGVKEMLSYALAIAVALSSLVLFSTAFLMSDIHRQDDFLWSGVGLFYALVLWFCARNITGAVLLGQAAAATMLVSYSWQTLKLRKAVANPEQAEEISNFSLLKAANGLLNRQKIKSQPETIAPPEKVTDETIVIPKAVEPPNSSGSSDKARSGRFGKFFGKQKKSSITNTKLDEILEEKASKTSKNLDNDVVKSVSVNIPKADKAKVTTKLELDQLAAENINNPKSSVASTQITQSVKEPVKTPQPKTDNSASIPLVPKEQPTVDSARKTSQPLTTEKAEPVPEAVDVPTSSVVQKEITQTVNPEVSGVEDSQIAENNPGELENRPQTKDISIKADETSQLDEKVVKPSVLDSLETVEVAEVLEALPEDLGSNRGQAEENIIEVTTAEIEEINIATEVTKVEQNPDKENDTK